jgi:hypothetical protein
LTRHWIIRTCVTNLFQGRSRKTWSRCWTNDASDFLPATAERKDAIFKGALYKTRPCFEFRDTGSCKLGERCSYAHGDHELRPDRGDTSLQPPCNLPATSLQPPCNLLATCLQPPATPLATPLFVHGSCLIILLPILLWLTCAYLRLCIESRDAPKP